MKGIKADQLVGKLLAVETAYSKEKIIGRCYAFDEESDFLILRMGDLPHGQEDKGLQFIKADSITHIEPSEKEFKPEQTPEVDAVSEEELRSIEAKGRAAAREALTQIGEGVSSQAQRVFDALAKTWKGETIIVMDDVAVRKPYDPASCTSTNEVVLARVKKVLMGEKQKMLATTS